MKNLLAFQSLSPKIDNSSMLKTSKLASPSSSSNSSWEQCSKFQREEGASQVCVWARNWCRKN